VADKWVVSAGNSVPLNRGNGADITAKRKRKIVTIHALGNGDKDPALQGLGRVLVQKNTPRRIRLGDFEYTINFNDAAKRQRICANRETRMTTSLAKGFNH